MRPSKPKCGGITAVDRRKNVPKGPRKASPGKPGGPLRALCWRDRVQRKSIKAEIQQQKKGGDDEERINLGQAGGREKNNRESAAQHQIKTETPVGTTHLGGVRLQQREKTSKGLQTERCRVRRGVRLSKNIT